MEAIKEGRLGLKKLQVAEMNKTTRNDHEESDEGPRTSPPVIWPAQLLELKSRIAEPAPHDEFSA